MNAWPDPDHTVIARYLGKLRLRSANSRIYYRQVLHGFQDVARAIPGHRPADAGGLAAGMGNMLAPIHVVAPCPHRRPLP